MPKTKPAIERAREIAQEIVQVTSGFPDPGCFQAADLVAANIIAAERRGAERMRERAAELAEARVVAWKPIPGEASYPAAATQGVCENLAKAIRTLPLDEPEER